MTHHLAGQLADATIGVALLLGLAWIAFDNYRNDRDSKRKPNYTRIAKLEQELLD